MTLPTDREVSLTEALIWMAQYHREIPEPKPCCADGPWLRRGQPYGVILDETRAARSRLIYFAAGELLILEPAVPTGGSR